MSKFFKCFKKAKNPEDGFESPNGKLKLNGYKENKSSAKISNRNGNHLQVNFPANGSQGSSVLDHNATPANMGCYEPENDTFRLGLRTPRDASHYSMDYPERGKAIIFNFMEFDNTNIHSHGLGARKGSDKDAKDLKACLEKLSFEVEIHENLDHDSFDIEYKKLQNLDHRAYDCLVVCVMTHGDKQNIYMSDGVTYPVNLVWEGFHADKCPSLAGKPKLFFIQACRGYNYDHGIRVEGGRSATEGRARDVTDSGSFSYVIPNAADILVTFSSPLGHYSWRDVEEGSWFIQAVCKVFNEKAYEHDVLTLMTFVAQEVALNYSSDTSEEETKDKRQVTSLTSTLIRIMKFKPKKYRGPPLHLSTSSNFNENSLTAGTSFSATRNGSYSNHQQIPQLITQAQIELTNAVNYSMTEVDREQEIDRIGSQV